MEIWFGHVARTNEDIVRKIGKSRIDHKSETSRSKKKRI